MALFDLCTRSCVTCRQIIPVTTFVSPANGATFHGIYELGDNEPQKLSCRSVNCIYMLECKTCRCQYVGETVRELKNRMGQHRQCRTMDKVNGNFRMRQHYACAEGRCKEFVVYIIQKLPDTGRSDEVQPNSLLCKIDANVTKVRKRLEDQWI